MIKAVEIGTEYYKVDNTVKAIPIVPEEGKNMEYAARMVFTIKK